MQQARAYQASKRSDAIGCGPAPHAVIEYGTSGKCLEPRGGATADGTDIVLSTGACTSPNGRFQFLSTGSIQHSATGKCLHPSNGSPNPEDGIKLVLWGGCNEVRLAFTPQSFGAIQHSSGKCLHPEGGTLTPSDGTRVVISTGCYHVWSIEEREPCRAARTT